MAVVVELSGTNTLSDRLLCSRWVEPRASPLMVPYLLLFWQYFNSEQMLTQPRVSSVSVRVTRLYTFKVCATQYFLMRATLSAVCMWCELNTVRLLGLEVWVGTRHDWLLSEVYQTFIISNLQANLVLYRSNMPSSLRAQCEGLLYPYSHFISIDSDKNADLKLNGQLFPPKMMVETKSELKNKKCILDLLPDCQKKTT